MRHKINAEFIKNIHYPSKGEVWVADIEIRGFGLRVWKNKSEGSFAFSIRCTDKSGKAIRKTYVPWKDELWVENRRDRYFSLRFSDEPYAKWEELDDPIFMLPFARRWARVEIGTLKGILEPSPSRHELEDEEATTRKASGTSGLNHLN